MHPEATLLQAWQTDAEQLAVQSAVHAQKVWSSEQGAVQPEATLLQAWQIDAEQLAVQATVQWTKLQIAVHPCVTATPQMTVAGLTPGLHTIVGWPHSGVIAVQVPPGPHTIPGPVGRTLIIRSLILNAMTPPLRG